MERAEVQALVERQMRAWVAADVEAIVADYAPDGVLISPAGSRQGRDAIRAAAEAFFATSADVRITLTRLLLDGDQGAIEWIWSEADRAGARRVTMEDAIVFVLRDGQIRYWREYFDTAALR